MSESNERCPLPEEIAAWIEGRVDAATRECLVAHALGCSRCFDLIEEVLELAGEERNTAGPEAGFVEIGGEVVPFRSRRRWLTAAATAAACAAFLVVSWPRGPSEQVIRKIIKPSPSQQRTGNVPANGTGFSPSDQAGFEQARPWFEGCAETCDTSLVHDFLEFALRDVEAAAVVVKEPYFAAWFARPEIGGDPGSLGCRLLTHARFTGTEEARFRDRYPVCRWVSPQPPADRDHSPAPLPETPH